VVDDAGGECAEVCSHGFLGSDGDGERGDGVAGLEDWGRDGVDVFVVFAVVGGVAALADAGELGGQVAGSVSVRGVCRRRG
jgi:hypothetical protein